MTYHCKKITLYFTVFFMSCTMQKEAKSQIKQGVYGYVTWLEGNVMPSPEMQGEPKGRPIERQINIYSVTGFDEVGGQPPLFNKVNTKLIKNIKSTSNGYYECELPPGVYSVFVVEPEGVLFANDFNVKGQISVVEVKPNKTVKLDIRVDYKAAH